MENNKELPKAVNTRNEDEIDLKEIIIKLWSNRKFILTFTGVFLVLGILIAFLSPVTYKATCTVVPQLPQKDGGNIGGLASIVGINLGSPMGGEILSPTVYPQIINSVPFCKELMQTEIIPEKYPNETITLYEYYTNPRYQKANILGIIKKYTIGLPGLIISSIKLSKDIDSIQVIDTDKANIYSLSKKENAVYQTIKDNIEYNSNSKDGFITLGYIFPEKKASAIIANKIQCVLESYISRFKSQKQLDNLDFVQQSFDEAKKDFYDKQAALALFQDRNRNLSSATARATERRLSSENDIAFTVYNELAKQLEQAKLAVKESTPVLTVINPITIPSIKHSPRKTVIIFGSFLIGLVLSILLVIFKSDLRELKKSFINH